MCGVMLRKASVTFVLQVQAKCQLWIALPPPTLFLLVYPHTSCPILSTCLSVCSYVASRF